MKRGRGCDINGELTPFPSLTVRSTHEESGTGTRKAIPVSLLRAGGREGGREGGTNIICDCTCLHVHVPFII